MNGIPGRIRKARCLVLGLLALFFCGDLSESIFAQTNTNRLDTSNRWLLVVNTSRAMQSRAEAIKQVAASLLVSGMNGQMQDGDTLGVWTYNETVHAGQFPLQQWTADNNRVIGGRVVKFLHTQTYEKESRFDEVLPQIHRIVRASPFISVILISDGSGEMLGTPFDEKINASYQSWQKEQKKSKMPIITLLRAKQGRITDYAVNTPPWPLELPPLPQELLLARSKPETVKTQRVAAPLIVTGQKSDVISTQIVVEASANPENTVEPLMQKLETVPVFQPTITVNPLPPQSTTGMEIAKAETAEPKPAVEPIVPKAENNPAPAEMEHKTLPPPAPLKTAPPPELPQPVQSAAVPSPQSFPDQKTILIGASTVLLIVVGTIFLRLRRTRDSQPISLITRSLDQDKK
jgi:hypothetical protein